MLLLEGALQIARLLKGGLQCRSTRRLLLPLPVELRAKGIALLAQRTPLPLRRLPRLGRTLQLARMALRRRTRLLGLGLGLG